LERPKQRKIDVRFSEWNVKSFCTVDSLKTTASELAKCNLYLVGDKDVIWFQGGSQPEEDYKFFSWKWEC
jgi:hypothetical protein